VAEVVTARDCPGLSAQAQVPLPNELSPRGPRVNAKLPEPGGQEVEGTVGQVRPLLGWMAGSNRDEGHESGDHRRGDYERLWVIRGESKLDSDRAANSCSQGPSAHGGVQGGGHGLGDTSNAVCCIAGVRATRSSMTRRSKLASLAAELGAVERVLRRLYREASP
jgi:hypothetical protein